MPAARAFWGRGPRDERHTCQYPGTVLYRSLADVVVVVHLGFLLFVALGGVLAWRWRKLIWAHVASVVWGVGIVWLGFDCPLTPLERGLRGRGGEDVYRESFVDRYVEGVVYPAEYTPHLRALAAVLIAVGWLRLLYLVQQRRRRPDGVERPPDTISGSEREPDASSRAGSASA